ncbi:tetratricopeptide repeat protein [Psychrobacter sp. NG25]|uniref:tetratricopeptide repeat protein n=1 Tax=Psychrobacter sp. NG25 TaxID=2782005 RepID=UPI001883DF8C|nr:tetratricopeptide repeat protein [Psychrobacter sp. NG25]MBF0658430.1 tetratricopeptide repeat protein [Psychrobacter sp. NG25]
MNPIYRTNLTKMGLLSVVVSASVLITGCNTTGEKKSASASVKALSAPSLVYLSGPNTVQRDFEAWMTIAKTNYDSKEYARALRAANEALAIDNQAVEARQIAMLSSIKVTEGNISAYHNDALMDSDDKDLLKDKLTNITTMIQSTN